MPLTMPLDGISITMPFATARPVESTTTPDTRAMRAALSANCTWDSWPSVTVTGCASLAFTVPGWNVGRKPSLVSPPAVPSGATNMLRNDALTTYSPGIRLCRRNWPRSSVVTGIPEGCRRRCPSGPY